METKEDKLRGTQPVYVDGVDLPAMVRALQASHNALLAKLDADVGVTDTNYAATLAITDLLTDPAV